jgi:CRISPR-associated endonuclease Cas1
MDIAAASMAEAVFSRDAHDSTVLVADGYGLSLSVSRGHLVVRDGLGQHRRERRLPRAQRTVRRIVILGHTGHLSLEAIRWCADTGIALTQIDTNGTLLLTGGGAFFDDPRLRRAQAAAATNPVGVEIARALLTTKLDGQARVADSLGATPAATHIHRLADELRRTDDLPRLRSVEAHASNTYFGAWAARAACRFADVHRDRVPEHWHHFGARTSPLKQGGGSPRMAADPINALLNYTYSLAEAECRLALQALGLDPGLGIVHTDKKNRDSLALDLLEPLRPVAEDHVLQLLTARHFTTDDFHETPQGSCRLLPPLTHLVAEALPQFAVAVAPMAEGIAHALARSSPGPVRLRTP